MTKSHKIKAFTIIELLVVMAISGIVFGMGYIGLSQAGGSLSAAIELSDEDSELLVLRDHIEFLVLSSNRIENGYDEFNFVNDSVTHVLSVEGDSLFTSTDFNCKVEELEISKKLFGKRQVEKDGLISEVEIQFVKNDVAHHWVFQKQYGAFEMMRE